MMCLRVCLFWSKHIRTSTCASTRTSTRTYEHTHEHMHTHEFPNKSVHRTGYGFRFRFDDIRRVDQGIMAQPASWLRTMCDSIAIRCGDLWKRMEWQCTVGGVRVGLLNHFLKACDLSGKHPGQRGETLNKLLKQSGSKGRMYKAKIQNKPGRQPWVGTQDTFRAVYDLV